MEKIQRKILLTQLSANAQLTNHLGLEPGVHGAEPPSEDGT